MTQFTNKWGISYPEGGQRVAVHTDVQQTATTTDAAITESVAMFEASVRSALITSGAATELVNLHPNPGAEYDNPSSMFAQGATSRTRTNDWAANGLWSWQCVHTDATSYGPGGASAFFSAGNIALNGADYAAGRITLHNATDAPRRLQVRLFAADSATSGSTAADGSAVASTSVDLAAGESQVITLYARGITQTRPGATTLRLQFWRLPGGGAAAGDVFHADDVLITTNPGELPPEGVAFDGDQPLFSWTGEPGFSSSVGLVATASDSGGEGIDTVLHVDPTTGDDSNTGTTWGQPLATIDAAFGRITGGRATVHLAPGVHMRPTRGLPSNTLLQGAGRDVTIIQAPAGYDTYAVLANASPGNGNRSFTIRDLTLDGNQANRPDDAGDWSTPSGSTTEPGTGLLLQRCGDFLIENVTVKNCVRRGIFIRGWSKNVWGRNGVLSAVYAIDNGSAGIHVGNAQRAMFYESVYAIGNGKRADYEGDPDLWGTGLAFDVSETTANGCYAYDNRGHGFYLRNVFSDNWNGLQANANDKHGILLSGITASVGSGWSAHKNGRGPVDTANYPDGWADIFFQDGTYNPSAGNYGETRESVFTGITAGITSTANWPAFLGDGGGTEAWAIYFQDATSAHGGPGKFLATQLVGAALTPGTQGTIRMPSAPDHGVTIV